MPEFILNGRESTEYCELPPFVRGYILAMFFTNQGEPDDSIAPEKGFHDLAGETLEQIKADCVAFVRETGTLLHDALGLGVLGYDETSAGADFWYTRNGHGVGYWSRGLGGAGDALTGLCGHGTDFPQVDAYTGDDGKIYLI